jgi:uncharacterized protein (UPF0332 family)
VKDTLKDIESLSRAARIMSGLAEQDLSKRDYDACPNHCYWAVFYMAQGAVLTKERISVSELSPSYERAVISLFEEHLARTGILEGHVATTLNHAYEKHIVVDHMFNCGTGTSVTQEEAQDLLATARNFIGEVKDYLDRWAEQK